MNTLMHCPKKAWKVTLRFIIGLMVAFTLFVDCDAQSYKRTEVGVISATDSLEIQVQFFTPKIVRIIKSPRGHKFSKESLSVIKTPERTLFSVKQQGDVLVLRSRYVNVTLDLHSGAVTFKKVSGDVLLREESGSTSFTRVNDAGISTYSAYQAFVLDEDEAIYGLGQQQAGKMIQRNISMNMIQGNTNDYVPIFQSVKGYGVFWDNYSPTKFVDTKKSTSFRSEVAECVDYYFMYGNDADGVVAQIRALTGQAPMFPLWTFGYWQCKERYKSQRELLEVVKKYRELEVPLDGIIQDWQYWGSNYLWNAMEFLNAEFPDPQRMVDEVHRQHAHVIISIWNSFGPETKQYKELSSINALLDFHTWPESGSDKWPPNYDYPSGVKVYDPYNPAARDIYWKYLKKLLSYGIDGWWMDSSEPDHLRFKPSDLDNKTYLGSFRKVRNAFPLMTVGGVYKHQREEDSLKRVFILTRSAFAGQQRYGSNTWSGDVVASWPALKNSISAGLNFSLTGIPYWNSDIGGFFLWNFPRKLDDPEYRELYVRWIEFGAFCPLMRSHGTDAPREIYQFGKEGDKVYDAIHKFIKIRYHLLPYIYSTSWDVTANQSSMMRALVMDFASDKKTWDINDQFMFGKSLMICPVTEPMYVQQMISGNDTIQVEDFSAVKSRQSYLPAGSAWFDFWTGEKLAGGVEVSREAPLDIIPLYVRAGSIVPVGPEVHYAEEKDWSDIELRVYSGADGKFILYEDEKDGYNYETGTYATTPITWNDKSRTLTIGTRLGVFPGMLQARTFRIVVVSEGKGVGISPGSQHDKVVSYSGKKMTIKL